MDPPVLRYKSLTNRLELLDAEESGRALPALRRVPARIKAVAGPILDDFLEVANECDALETRLAAAERELDKHRKANAQLNERLSEAKANVDLVLPKYTASVEQTATLRKQLENERAAAAEQHKQSQRTQREAGEQVNAFRKEIEELRKDNKKLKTSLAERKRRPSVAEPPSTDVKTRKDVQQQDEIKRLIIQTTSLNDDLQHQLNIRRDLEVTAEKALQELVARDRTIRDLSHKNEAIEKTVFRLQDKMASTQEFLNMDDVLKSDTALKRIIRLNEDISHISGLISTSAPLMLDEEKWPKVDDRDRLNVTGFMSRHFLPLLRTKDIGKRRMYLDLAIRACLVSQVELIVEGGCFGLRPDLDQFLLQLIEVVQSEMSQPTAARWRAVTHQAIRQAPEFPINHNIASYILQYIAAILALAGCSNPEDEAEKWSDIISSIHGAALALEVDFKQKVMSTFYHLRVPSVNALFQAVEMNDVSVLVETLRGPDDAPRAGVRRVLGTVSLGLVALTGPSRKKSGAKMKTEIRLEPTVLLDDILPEIL